ncbi:hypothetical protein DPMN_036217 [Dreissena polymorpha]|uniref:Uncharacterized protein n=1 Tax=Dreissena polymorpha TaxID=45954 RepID=A0A9D4MAA9_DREPO|nr:hypothetical protein DPMN_036217 [Dreissena polymorpha]
MVMLWGLDEIRIEMRLLEIGMQLMTLLTTFFLTMKETPWRCFEFSPQNHLLWPSSFDVSPKPRT